MKYTWTQNMTAEQVEAIKALIPDFLLEKKARDLDIFARFLPDPAIDEQEYLEAMAFHRELDAFILGEWAREVTVEDGVASATINWALSPTKDPWEMPFIQDRVWDTLRDVPLTFMRPRLIIDDPENGQAKFDFYQSLVAAVDGKDG